ncbi:hypothetical protein QBC33DRAFT_554065 [Phialemonium atrogriseum]|uniref:Uncharacterized protein n=1 Tax=Phialemonium atrogriseum TaxID=1093897 RepID=A0AAJ0C9T6_9PEZI|nr:uncharacterized protein QBC33DRAFT_554065 [Phialemonium atrogriseum]KAK1772615.1 hypothetical protein QBC33DRAFT_554065 [Phialemonium atrogriseum]
MDNINNATARLRRTFAYPADDSSSTGEPDTMDEEEQETLIATLATQNAQRNSQFRLLLFLLPLLSAIPHLLTLLSPSSPALPSLLALTSLSSTAYLLHRLPAASTGIPALDNRGRGPAHKSSPPPNWAAAAAAAAAARSPLETYLPYLNLGLCAVLVVMGLLAGGARDGARGAAGLVWLGSLPGLVYGVVLVSKMVMASVDPERELGGLRYGYKGA